MPRKPEPYKVIGMWTNGRFSEEMRGQIPDEMYEEIPEEIYGTDKWRDFFYKENVIMAKALGGKPKQQNNETNRTVIYTE